MNQEAKVDLQAGGRKGTQGLSILPAVWPSPGMQTVRQGVDMQKEEKTFQTERYSLPKFIAPLFHRLLTIGICLQSKTNGQV